MKRYVVSTVASIVVLVIASAMTADITTVEKTTIEETSMVVQNQSTASNVSGEEEEKKEEEEEKASTDVAKATKVEADTKVFMDSVVEVETVVATTAVETTTEKPGVEKETDSVCLAPSTPEYIPALCDPDIVQDRPVLDDGADIAEYEVSDSFVEEESETSKDATQEVESVEKTEDDLVEKGNCVDEESLVQTVSELED